MKSSGKCTHVTQFIPPLCSVDMGDTYRQGSWVVILFPPQIWAGTWSSHGHSGPSPPAGLWMRPTGAVLVLHSSGETPRRGWVRKPFHTLKLRVCVWALPHSKAQGMCLSCFKVGRWRCFTYFHLFWAHQLSPRCSTTKAKDKAKTLNKGCQQDDCLDWPHCWEVLLSDLVALGGVVTRAPWISLTLPNAWPEPWLPPLRTWAA